MRYQNPYTRFVYGNIISNMLKALLHQYYARNGAHKRWKKGKHRGQTFLALLDRLFPWHLDLHFFYKNNFIRTRGSFFAQNLRQSQPQQKNKVSTVKLK